MGPRHPAAWECQAPARPPVLIPQPRTRSHSCIRVPFVVGQGTGTWTAGILPALPRNEMGGDRGPPLQSSAKWRAAKNIVALGILPSGSAKRHLDPPLLIPQPRTRSHSCIRVPFVVGQGTGTWTAGILPAPPRRQDGRGSVPSPLLQSTANGGRVAGAKRPLRLFSIACRPRMEHEYTNDSASVVTRG